MAIIKEIGFYDFERAFIDFGRNENFSYEGKRILYDYLENLSDEIGEPLVLDIIALCCDYTESSLIDVCNDYGIEYDPDLPEYALYQLQNQTMVCGSYDDEDGDTIVIYLNY